MKRKQEEVTYPLLKELQALQTIAEYTIQEAEHTRENYTHAKYPDMVVRHNDDQGSSLHIHLYNGKVVLFDYGSSSVKYSWSGDYRICDYRTSDNDNQPLPNTEPFGMSDSPTDAIDGTGGSIPGDAVRDTMRRPDDSGSGDVDRGGEHVHSYVRQHFDGPKYDVDYYKCEDCPSRFYVTEYGS